MLNLAQAMADTTPMPRLLARIAAVMIAGACLSGCGNATGHAPISSTVAKGTQFQPTSKSFRITTPAGWKGLNSHSLATGAAAVAKANPALANMKSQLVMLSKNPNLVFVADATKAGRTIALTTGFSVNGLARSGPMDVNLSNVAAEKAVVTQYATQAQQLNVPFTHHSTTLAGHPAVVLSYVFVVHASAGVINVRESDTILVWHKNLYIISLSAPVTNAADYRSTFSGILQSFDDRSLGLVSRPPDRSQDTRHGPHFARPVPE